MTSLLKMMKADDVIIDRITVNELHLLNRCGELLHKLCLEESAFCEAEGAKFYADDISLETCTTRARTNIVEQTTYGLYVNGVLVAIATYHAEWKTIYGVYVDEEYRRKGYARKLLEFIKSNHPIHHIHVIIGNKPALRFYETLGFKLHPVMQMNLPEEEIVL